MAKGTINKVQLVGNVGKDPETRMMNEVQVTTFPLATTEYSKGEFITEWHNIVVFGKTAEVVDKYVGKGSKLFVEGSIKTSRWEDKDGNKKNATQIIGRQVEMLGGQSKEKSSSQGQLPKAAGQDFKDDVAPF